MLYLLKKNTLASIPSFDCDLQGCTRRNNSNLFSTLLQQAHAHLLLLFSEIQQGSAPVSILDRPYAIGEAGSHIGAAQPYLLTAPRSWLKEEGDIPQGIFCPIEPLQAITIEMGPVSSVSPGSYSTAIR